MGLVVCLLWASEAISQKFFKLVPINRNGITIKSYKHRINQFSMWLICVGERDWGFDTGIIFLELHRRIPWWYSTIKEIVVEELQLINNMGKPKIDTSNIWR